MPIGVYKHHKASEETKRKMSLAKKGKKIHWANISRKYKRDITDWIRLCTPCHSKFDFTEEKRKFLKKINTKLPQVNMG